ncbi:MAG: Maf family nucleotide pyrophosphatase [Candidatus Protistobacter heckmanni]|nr:Maf family nucleotide pyrophosphatase [Candidatus Protistobacter heckmanni]
MSSPSTAHKPPHIYLASQSPRRRELLDQLGVRYALLLGGPEEDAEALEAVLEGEAAVDYVQRVTLLKTEAALQRLARRRLPPLPVLCADTTVSLGGAILGKPADAAEARAMLARLSGTEHLVYTAVGAGDPAGGVHAALSTSRVRMRPLEADEIDRYVAGGEPMGKAGAYGIQGRAAEFVEAIEGSYSGIMGLPLFETAALLRGLKVDFP